MKKFALGLVAAFSAFCATIVNDAMIPIDFSFADGSSGECTFQNKRGVWQSKIPNQVYIRRSDDDLIYDCEMEDGRESKGSIRSELEGEKVAASVIFWDLGITDAITDKARRYESTFIIPVRSPRPETTE